METLLEEFDNCDLCICKGCLEKKACEDACSYCKEIEYADYQMNCENFEGK